MISIEKKTMDKAFPISMSEKQHTNFGKMAKERGLPLSKIIRALLENASNLNLPIEIVEIEKQKSMSVRLTDTQHEAFTQYANGLGEPLNDIIVSLLQKEYNEYTNQD